MKPLFIDTSFLLALGLSDDQHHDRAVAWQRHIGQPLLTTEFVLLELLDAMCSTEQLRTLAVSTIDLLRSDPAIRVIPASSELLDQGIQFFRQRPDKQWSLTDCISFVTMHAARISDALSSDHHFEQAGFSALLRREPP